MNKVKSFTLIEMLIVIAIIGIISGIIMISVGDSVEKANMARSKVFADSVKSNFGVHLVSEWKMEESADDSWGYNNGIATEVTFLEANDCPMGQCGSFNGTSSHINVSDTSAFNFGSEMSAFIWVKGDPQIQKTIFNHWDAGASDRSWLIRSDDSTGDKLVVSVTDDGTLTAGHRMQYETPESVLDDTWHFVGFTWDSGELKVYVDGTESAVVKVLDDSITSLHNSSSDLEIGCSLNSGVPNGFFTGALDEAQVYNSSITEARLNDIYLSGLEEHN